MSRSPDATIAYGWPVEQEIFDSLLEVSSPPDPTAMPEELWGYFEQIVAIGWEKKTFYNFTQELDLNTLGITTEDQESASLFRDWLIENQSNWPEEIEETLTKIINTPPKLLIICDYS